MTFSDIDRKAWLQALALATPEALAAAWDALSAPPDYTLVRAPETGLVMVRGRMGGGGAPFNAGEATMTRCVVKLSTGEVGFGHVLGRDVDHARLVALFDATAQSAVHGPHVRGAVIPSLIQERQVEVQTEAGEVAATKVDFFTMVRGED